MNTADGWTLMLERIEKFIALDHIGRVMFIEERIRRQTNPRMRAYVGMFWASVYNRIGEQND